MVLLGSRKAQQIGWTHPFLAWQTHSSFVSWSHAACTLPLPIPAVCCLRLPPIKTAYPIYCGRTIPKTRDLCHFDPFCRWKLSRLRGSPWHVWHRWCRSLDCWSSFCWAWSTANAPASTLEIGGRLGICEEIRSKNAERWMIGNHGNPHRMTCSKNHVLTALKFDTHDIMSLPQSFWPWSSCDSWRLDYRPMNLSQAAPDMTSSCRSGSIGFLCKTNCAEPPRKKSSAQKLGDVWPSFITSSSQKNKVELNIQQSSTTFNNIPAILASGLVCWCHVVTLLQELKRVWTWDSALATAINP